MLRTVMTIGCIVSCIALTGLVGCAPTGSTANQLTDEQKALMAGTWLDTNSNVSFTFDESGMLTDVQGIDIGEQIQGIKLNEPFTINGGEEFSATVLLSDPQITITETGGTTANVVITIQAQIQSATYSGWPGELPTEFLSAVLTITGTVDTEALTMNGTASITASIQLPFAPEIQIFPPPGDSNVPNSYDFNVVKQQS